MSRSFVITTEEPNWWPIPPAEASFEAGGTEQEPSAERANGWDRKPVALVRFADSAGLADWVASLLLRERLLRPERPLGLATGRTMEPVYAALARQVNGLTPAERQELRMRWCSFNLDAYVGLDRADPRSFAAEMTSRLTTPLGLDPERVHLPDGQATADPHAAAECYAAQLAATGGIGLQLLGLGLNGHVGFNEPPCDADAPCRCVELSPATRHQNAEAFGGDPEDVPQQAITLGLREILAAERLLLVVTGASKAEVLARALQQPPTPELPASWIQLHPRALVVADGAAAALLDGGRNPPTAERAASAVAGPGHAAEPDLGARRDPGLRATSWPTR
jgi:glucosamine-6-phosphate deaminase